MRITDKNYVMNAIIVSVVCGLTETLTIPNYDNITIFVVSVLTYNYVKCIVYYHHLFESEVATNR